MFEVDEYLHLALHASSKGEHHACMSYLKQALQLQPENATAIYLLAVQHTELGLHQRAISGMRAALAIDPQLEIVRFLLGMLLLEGNHPAEAREQFSALNGRDPVLQTYAEAMVAMIDNDLVVARQKLEVGLAREPANPALATLMQRLLEQLAKSNEAQSSQSDSRDNRILLGAYGETSS